MQSNSVQSTRIIKPYSYLTAVAIQAELAYSALYSASGIASRKLWVGYLFVK